MRDVHGTQLDRLVPIQHMRVPAKRVYRSPPADVYIVERILGHKSTPHGRQYLVKWRGYEHPTWEPVHHIRDRELIRDYEAAHPSSSPSSSSISSSRVTCSASTSTLPSS